MGCNCLCLFQCSNPGVLLISITFSGLFIFFSSLFFFTFSRPKKAISHQNEPFSKPLINSEENSQDKTMEIINKDVFLAKTQDFYSESDQSMEKFSSEDDDYDSISDEESLFEIDIPGGQFVNPDEDYYYPKLSADLCYEEDNLIEIDICMGSIKCNTFAI